MSEVYNHHVVEKKWQQVWDDEKAFAATNDFTKPKYYALVEFPYPSGQGLHVGHPRPYTALDIVARKRRMQGYNVLYPMGWDAFGLPTENYAIKNHIHPKIVTENNVKRFKEQLHSLGYSFDWDREINTTDPKYYHWTQWIFRKLFEEGLAYKKEMPINWCTSCKVGLANEEVVNGVCERCGSPVVRKVKSEWMLKITEYADKLIDGLDTVDYIERVKVSQKNWIGRSTGAEVDFAIKDTEDKLTVYTTRCDTLFGATYMVVSPEHPYLDKYKDKISNFDAILAYREEAAKKSDFERSELAKDKTGVQVDGIVAVNPVNGKEIPIWVSDYVLMSYGTGAIMAVPAHDDRDWEFAKKFDLPIIQVIAPTLDDVQDGNEMTEAYTAASGVMVNSGEWNGMESAVLKKEAPKIIEEKGFGKATTNYKLRDWVFSRQRYWGEPIPIVHCEKCGCVAVPEEELPLRLPEVEKYEPTGTGESPLAAIEDWVNCTCPQCGGPAKRETNTMPQWAGSSWYFLRYVDVHNDKELVSREKADKYLPVDMYIGGVEHAVLHLLYSRFWTKFLYDIGVVGFDEPFNKLFNQGMICGRDKVTGKPTKMSKSLGNIVSPDDIVRDYGCDTLRLYELFVGPPEADAIWDDAGIDGIYRFIKRFYGVVTDNVEKYQTSGEIAETPETLRLRNGLVKAVTERLESFNLNTVVSAFMEYNNKFVDITKTTGIDRETLKTAVRLIAPFAPHIGEELWEVLGGTESVFNEMWPECDEAHLVTDEITLPVQVSGKTRLTINVPADASKDDILAAAKEALGSRLDGKTIVKEIYVPGKIINIVAK